MTKLNTIFKTRKEQLKFRSLAYRPSADLIKNKDFLIVKAIKKQYFKKNENVAIVAGGGAEALSLCY